MENKIMANNSNMGSFAPGSLQHHVKEVIGGIRRFETAFQSVSRMILGNPELITRTTVNGRSTYDFKVFRDKKKHIIGMFDEINSFVSFVKDAAEGGSSAEMAFVLIGEPGNGKTFLVDYLNKLYREFTSLEENRRYTFRFKDLDKIGGYGKITSIESQTFEDPMILALNIFENSDDSIEFIQNLGATNEQIAKYKEILTQTFAFAD